MIARMKRLLLVAVLLAAAPASALADYDGGREAYRTGDFEGALREWLPLVRSDDPRVRHSLGILFLYGRAVERDAEAAAALFAQAAEEGLPDSQYALATLFRDGTGVSRNVAEAVRLYRLAAVQDHVGAQTSLGILYANGDGVERDGVAAQMWFQLAEARGDPRAAVNGQRLAGVIAPD